MAKYKQYYSCRVCGTKYAAKSMAVKCCGDREAVRTEGYLCLHCHKLWPVEDEAEADVCCRPWLAKNF